MHIPDIEDVEDIRYQSGILDPEPCGTKSAAELYQGGEACPE